jgi:hypothetical protein
MSSLLYSWTIDKFPSFVGHRWFALVVSDGPSMVEDVAHESESCEALICGLQIATRVSSCFSSESWEHSSPILGRSHLPANEMRPNGGVKIIHVTES